MADILATATQNARYVDRVRQLAYRDGLTGVFNRRYFESRLVDEVPGLPATAAASAFL